MNISRRTAKGELQLHLFADEAELLSTLVSQLISLFRDYSPTTASLDPLLASLDVGGASSIPSDPALARLLPNAYDDEDQSSDFRQVAERGIVNRKILDAENVLIQIESARLDQPSFSSPDDAEVLYDDLPTQSGGFDEGMLTLTLSEESFLSWVKTLSSMRLALAARLGIETDADLDKEPIDDMEANTRAVYEWLADFAEALLQSH